MRPTKEVEKKLYELAREMATSNTTKSYSLSSQIKILNWVLNGGKK